MFRTLLTVMSVALLNRQRVTARLFTVKQNWTNWDKDCYQIKLAGWIMSHSNYSWISRGRGTRGTRPLKFHPGIPLCTHKCAGGERGGGTPLVVFVWILLLVRVFKNKYCASLLPIKTTTNYYFCTSSYWRPLIILNRKCSITSEYI